MENSRYNLRDRKPQDEGESSEESQWQDSLFPLRRDLRLDFPQESDEGSPVDQLSHTSLKSSQEKVCLSRNTSFVGKLDKIPP